MKSMFDNDHRRDLLDRLARLTPLEPARWGSMNAPKMVSHLIESMRMATGELTIAPKKRPLRYPPVKQLVIYWLPFPKGVPTAPALLARTPAEWESDVAALRAAFAGCAARPQHGPWPAHPIFGRMTGRAWGVLSYRHADHHFRQFGV